MEMTSGRKRTKGENKNRNSLFPRVMGDTVFPEQTCKKKREKKNSTPKTLTQSGKEQKRRDACGFMLPCPQTHLTHCVYLFCYKFQKNNAAFVKNSPGKDLYVVEAGNPCYADEGFQRKSSYNWVILGDLSKILQSSSFIALYLVPCGCSTHSG